MKEIWKDIKGYEGLYQISNLGRVKSLRNNIFLKPGDINGYLRVQLSNNGIDKKYYIHRLVGTNFIPNPNDYKEINHKDEDKSNNNVSNLEWCDRYYNINYGTALQRGSEKHSKKIIGINIKDNSKVTFNSIIEAESLGFNSSAICLAAKGKRKTHRGYKWSYSDGKAS
jgi:hypothetical protein